MLQKFLTSILANMAWIEDAYPDSVDRWSTLKGILTGLTSDAQQRNEAERAGAGTDLKHSTSDTGGVFSLPECIFNYCPYPDLCKAGGCLHPTSK